MFKIILDMPLPPHLDTATENPEDIAVRDKSIQWKIKAQAARITFRLFSKYTSTKYLQGDELAWNKSFLEQYAETLCESHLQIMFKRKTNFVGSKTLNYVIKLVTSATKVKKTMDRLIPFIDNILYETAIPLMLTSNRDQQLFEEDPIEYIRKQQDIMETIYMPKNTTIDLLQLICQYKTKKGKGQKPDYLMPFLSFASSNMQQYADACAAGGNPDWRIKEALLFSIGNLNEVIHLYDDLSANIEPMLKAHVLADLSSPHLILRSRACWTYGQFSYYQFSDDQHIQ